MPPSVECVVLSFGEWRTIWLLQVFTWFTARGSHFSLLICDWSRGALSGLECLSHTMAFHSFQSTSSVPVVAHLAYADDVIIFSSGARSSLSLLKRVLQQYSSASG